MIYDVAIIGAGVIGGMVARELSKYQLKVVLLEKEHDVACGASKANSGIIHGGFDPEPNTLKAKLNASGVAKLYEAARDLSVPHHNNGSLVCAFGEDEEPAIRELYDRGIANGINGMSIISGEEARALEPALSDKITLALRIRSAGIICPYELTVASIGNAMDNGVELICNFAVSSVEEEDGVYSIKSDSDEAVRVKYIMNCAGVNSDKVSAMVGDDSFEIIPRAGQYMLLDKAEGTRVNHTIFQVPSKEGKGILVSPTADGNLLVGPTAERVDSADDNYTSQGGLDTVTALARKSVPSVNFRQVITSFAGVRSSEKNGDFIVEKAKNTNGVINVAAIDSPGLTSCVSIAEYATEKLFSLGLQAEKKEAWNGKREDARFFSKMSDEEKNVFIKKHSEYGKIVCRCEGVSEGEILYAIRTNPPARDLDAVKRRTRSGMGRCQGGFCSPYVMKLISRETGIPKEKITKRGTGSEMLIGKI